MSSTPSASWPIDEVRSAVLALNDPQRPIVYTIDDDVVTARWKFDDPAWATRLDASRGASANFRYTVKLSAGDASFRWFEQDAGIDNGRFRAYRGYNRGVSINLFTIIVGLVRRLSRPTQDASTEDIHTREQVSAPLLDVLGRAGWRNRGVTI